MARYGKKSLVYALGDFLPYLATFVCSPNLPVDCECGKKEREDFIALIEGDWVCLCAKVCPHHITQVVLKV